ncbi:MAG: hypothetical protein ACI8VE_001202, partial [Natrialbaceae archaeon]
LNRRTYSGFGVWWRTHAGAERWAARLVRFRPDAIPRFGELMPTAPKRF